MMADTVDILESIKELICDLKDNEDNTKQNKNTSYHRLSRHSSQQLRIYSQKIRHIHLN